MQEQFVDRILTCVDCHGEFIFTAGEQLFFFDKQFKNDPKRCKPCKSRRSGLSAAANGASPVAAGLSRTETRTQCSDCGIETTVPFKPTQGRPVLCRQCFQMKNRAAAALAVAVQAGAQLPAAAIAADAAALTAASRDAAGAMLSPDAAILAASSMAFASAQSTISTPADLAYVASIELEAGAPALQPPLQTAGQLAAQLLADTPAELLKPAVQAAELQGATVEAAQA